MIVQGVFRERYFVVIANSIWLIVCLIVWKLYYKLGRFINPALFILYLGHVLTGMVIIKSHLPYSICNVNFYQGFSFGVFEKIITVRTPNFILKLLFGLITFGFRVYLFPADSFFTWFMQGFIIAFSLFSDYWKEKEERKLFQEFYKYREGLTKFKTLIVSDLPTNILILSRDLKQILFRNEELISSIHMYKSIGGVDSEVQLLLQWLEDLKIENGSLNEESKSAIITSRLRISANQSVLHFLKTINARKSLLNSEQQKYCFNAEFEQEQDTKKMFEAKVFSLTWDGKDAIAVILNDATEHRQNLTLKVADANKNKMLAMISHELRTPLNGILGVVNILKKEITETRLLQYLSICKNSGELLLNLVNSILDLQQIKDNKFVLKPTKDDLRQLLIDIYELFLFQFEQKNLYLDLHITEDLPEYIITDQNRLRQILINLIGNALKFTFTGGVTISASVDPLREGYVHFEVADTGTGIKEEDKKKLFKMYGRLDQPDPKMNTQGVGLGLEISNQLARLLSDDFEGGGIKVESQEGKGTTFSFSIKDASKADQEYLICSPGLQDLNYYEPRVFAEDIEDIAVKISAYGASIGALNEKVLIPKSSKLLELNYQFQSESETELKGGAKSSSSELPITNELTAGLSNKLRYRSKSKKFRSVAQSSVFKSPKASYHLPLEGESSDLSIFIPSTLFDKKRKDSQRRLKILLVDDNTFNLMIAKNLLENMNYIVETALNGKLAIEEVVKTKGSESLRISAILMDIQMPVMDGYAATKALRQMMKKKEIYDIPVIAVSANDSEDDKKRSREAGMYSHLSKPLYEGNLRSVLEEVLGKTLYDDEGLQKDT